MKKDELKPGMIVTKRNGEKGMLLQDIRSGEYYITSGFGANSSLDCYTDDLRYISKPIFKRPGETKPEPEYDIIDVRMPDFRFLTGEQPYIPWAQISCYGSKPTAEDYADIYTKMYHSADNLYWDLYSDLCRRFKGIQDVYDLPGFQKMVDGFKEIRFSVSDINWSREK